MSTVALTIEVPDIPAKFNSATESEIHAGVSIHWLARTNRDDAETTLTANIFINITKNEIVGYRTTEIDELIDTCLKWVKIC